MIVHVTHADGSERSYSLALTSYKTVRNTMMNPNGIVTTTDGTMIRTSDWMKVIVEQENVIRHNNKFNPYGNKEYAMVMETIKEFIDTDPTTASRNLMVPPLSAKVGPDKALMYTKSMICRHVLLHTEGRRGFPLVYTYGPQWEKDWLDSHHDGPMTVEYLRERNAD